MFWFYCQSNDLPGMTNRVVAQSGWAYSRKGRRRRLSTAACVSSFCEIAGWSGERAWRNRSAPPGTSFVGGVRSMISAYIWCAVNVSASLPPSPPPRLLPTLVAYALRLLACLESSSIGTGTAMIYIICCDNVHVPDTSFIFCLICDAVENGSHHRIVVHR